MKDLLVIIPVFNGEKYLNQTLNSVIQQKEYADILVIDNKSTDKTVEIVKEKQIEVLVNDVNIGQTSNWVEATEKKPIEVIINDINLGRIGNWNKALQEFKNRNYKYLKIIFAGDYLNADCLKTQLDDFKTDQELGLITCAHDVIIDNEKRYTMWHFKEDKILNRNQVLEICSNGCNFFGGTISCMMFSKESIQNNIFDEQLQWVSDWKFYIDCAIQSKKIKYLAKPLTNFYKPARNHYNLLGGKALSITEENYIKEYCHKLLCA